MITSVVQPSVLIVDDEELVRRTLYKSLSQEGFRCDEADCADQALQHLRSNLADVAILDIKMPGKSGCELLTDIREYFPETAVLMATAVIEPDIIVKCMKEGAQDYITKPFDVDEIVESIKRVLEKRNLEIDLNRRRKMLEVEVEEQTRMLQKMFSDSVKSLVSALEAKDPYTAGHSRRVTDIAVTIGQGSGLSDDELEDLRWAALLHDIGKIGIDPEVQNKPGELTSEEYRYIQEHCSIGPGIVQSLVNEKIVEIIRHHHDRFDGSRANQTVKGVDIPLGARIIAVADTFDAMTSDRPYRSAVSADAAVAEIKRCVGTQLDPKIVELFLETLLPIS